MEYRKIGKSGVAVSTVGIGAEHLSGLPRDQVTLEKINEVIGLAIESGVNLIDTATSFPQTRDLFGQALKGRREKMMLTGHLGCNHGSDGQYERTRDVRKVQMGFEDLLKRLQTDYIDFGLIHYVDESEDFDRVFSDGVFEYALKLKKEGYIKHLGFSSHNVEICERFLDTEKFDFFMFSINAAYDLVPSSNSRVTPENPANLSMAERRMKLYQRAESMGTGILVMKPLGAGRLLDARTSPFESAMSIPQCLAYCLDRPAVTSCLVGVSSTDDLREVLTYYSASPEEKDYSFIARAKMSETNGLCVYCNHCLPCPAGINIGMVNKFLDLAVIGDSMAESHYKSMQKTASHCIGCGSCEQNCPFGVQVQQRMERAKELFGR